MAQQNPTAQYVWKRPASAALLAPLVLLSLLLVLRGNNGAAACLVGLPWAHWAKGVIEGALAFLPVPVSLFLWCVWLGLICLFFHRLPFTRRCTGAIALRLAHGSSASHSEEIERRTERIARRLAHSGSGCLWYGVAYGALCAVLLVLVLRALGPVVCENAQISGAERTAALPALTGRLTGLAALLAALLFAPFAVWKTLVGQEQATAASKQSETAAEKADIDREIFLSGLLSEALGKLTAVINNGSKTVTKEETFSEPATSDASHLSTTGRKTLGTTVRNLWEPNHIDRLAALATLERIAPQLPPGTRWQIAETIVADIQEENRSVKRHLDSVGDGEDDQAIHAADQARLGRARVVAGLRVLGAAAKTMPQPPFRLQLRGLDLDFQRLAAIDLRHCSLRDLSLHQASLVNITFRDCDIEELTLTEADVESHDSGFISFENIKIDRQTFAGSYFNNITMKNVRFISCYFDGIYFKNCHFESCAFEGCSFERAHFDDCTFTNVRGMTDQSLEKTTAQGTAPPEGVTPPPSPRWIARDGEPAPVMQEHKALIEGRARRFMP